MGINHQEPAYTDKAAPFIEEFGGKLGGLQYLNTIPGLEEQVLPIRIVKPGESCTPGVVHNIVRASHPHDFQGLVNVISSVKVNLRENDINDMIGRIRDQARSEDVMQYARYENPAYDGNVTIGVQPLFSAESLRSDAYRRGSIVDHPNRPGTYLVEWVDEWEDVYGHNQRNLESDLFDDNGMPVEEFPTMNEDHNAPAIVRMHRDIRQSGLVRDDYAFQVEFGQRTPRSLPHIYQVRAFMRKALAGFSIDPAEANCARVFGITGAAGMRLAILLHTFGAPDSPAEPVALLVPQPRDGRNLAFRPPAIGAYLAGTTHNTSVLTNMQHGNFWAAQKADVTVFEQSIDAFNALSAHEGRLRDAPEGLTGKQVHIVSDGTRAIFRAEE